MAESPGIYWDSCTFLAYINEEPNRVETVSELLERSARGEIRLYTSALSLVEVAFSKFEKDGQSLDDDALNRIDSLWDIVTVVDYQRRIGDLARALMRQAIIGGLTLKAYDAVQLCTAQWLSNNGAAVAEIHTYDQRLSDFTTTIGIEIREPYIQNPRLLP